MTANPTDQDLEQRIRALEEESIKDKQTPDEKRILEERLGRAERMGWKHTREYVKSILTKRQSSSAVFRKPTG